MVSRLSSRGDAPQGGQQAQAPAGGWGGQQQGGQQAQQAAQAPQGGWGGQAGGNAGGWGGQGGGAQQGHDQRQAVQEAIMPRESVRGAFTGGVQQQADQIAQGDYGATTGGGNAGGWGQGAGQAPFEGGQPAGQSQAAEPPKRSRSRKAEPAPAGGNVGGDPDFAATVRMQVLVEVLRTSPESDVAEVIDITDELVNYILTGDKK